MSEIRKHRAAIILCSATLCFSAVAMLSARQGNNSTPQSGASPAQQAAANSDSQNGEFKIKVGVNSVLVPVVVRDAHGRAIGDLTQKDFALFDRDKPTPIVGFTVQKRGTATETPTQKPESATPPATPAVPSITLLDTTPKTPERFIAFLFDDLHFEPAELLRVKTVATKILGQSVGDSDMAAVVTTSGTSSGMTRDHAVLEAAIEKIAPHPLYRADPRACPPIDMYQADLIVNKHNMQALDAAVAAYAVCSHTTPPENGPGQMGGLTVGENMGARMARGAAAQVLELGDRDVSVTLSSVKEFVRRMGRLPGQQHTLILVSPGFLTVTPNATREKSDLLDLAARANVTISALDARGLYATNLDASQRGASSARDLMTGETLQYHSETMNQSEDVMSELANGTGGTFFHNSNDLAGGFTQLAQAPEYVYLLEMSLDKVRPDGTYHLLKVKVARDNLKAESRRGYVAPQPPPKQKRAG